MKHVIRANHISLMTSSTTDPWNFSCPKAGNTCPIFFTYKTR